MANLGLADDGLQVRRGLEIIGVGTAHEWFDGRLPDGPAKEQLDDGVFGHGSDARQDLDQLVVPGVGPCQVNVLHVSPERFLALNGQPVQNGLRVLGTAAVFHRFYSRDKFTKKTNKFNNSYRYCRISEGSIHSIPVEASVPPPASANLS